MRTIKKVFTGVNIILVLLVTSHNTFAQKANSNHHLSGNTIVLTTQAQVDAFVGRTSVKGNLVIRGQNISSINLPNLNSVSGTVKIYQNPRLESILCGFRFCGDPVNGGSLIIEKNRTLTELNLPSLTKVYGAFSIAHNDKLLSLNNFLQLKQLGALIIEKNISLRTLSNFNNLTLIKGATKTIEKENGVLLIKGNDALINLDFLRGLKTIESLFTAKVSIQENGNISNIDGLRQLNLLKGKHAAINISDNPLLRNIDGLTNVVPGSSPKIFITVRNNPNLTRCCGLYNLLPQKKSPYAVIAGNGGTCTQEEIKKEDACPANSSCYIVQLSSQEQIDNFRKEFGCTSVLNLRISGEDIINLNGLTDITTLYGSLYIYDNPLLTSIAGLGSINAIQPPDIQFIGGVQITNNPQLQSLTGLDLLTDLSGAVVIKNNKNLKNIDALSSVKSIFGDLTIRDNQSLENIDGLSSLELISTFRYWNGLSIINNDALQNLNGLSSLNGIEGYSAGLEIIDNNTLTTLEGLSSFMTLSGYVGNSKVKISNNTQLKSINQLLLSNVNYSIDSLLITNNSQLSMCCALSNILLNYPPEVVEISGNASTCTFEQIIRADGPCSPYAVSEEQGSLSLYPNPNNGAFEFQMNGLESGLYRVLIKDGVGNIVKDLKVSQASFNTITAVDLRPLANGLYVLSITNGEKVITTRRIAVRN